MSDAARGCRVSTAGMTGSRTRVPRGLPAVPAFRTAFAFFALVTVNSCNESPERPDGEVRPVTARDLVKDYRLDPHHARLTFTGQRVRVLVTACQTRGAEIHWKLVYADPPVPPVLVFRFAAPPAFKPPGWIEGVCGDRQDDGVDRGMSGYTFRLVISDCRLAPAPTSPAP
jgi:hypothetical protein